MRYILALLLPWLTFFTMGKVFQGFLLPHSAADRDRMVAGDDLGVFRHLEL